MAQYMREQNQALFNIHLERARMEYGKRRKILNYEIASNGYLKDKRKLEAKIAHLEFKNQLAASSDNVQEPDINNKEPYEDESDEDDMPESRLQHNLIKTDFYATPPSEEEIQNAFNTWSALPSGEIVKIANGSFSPLALVTLYVPQLVEGEGNGKMAAAAMETKNTVSLNDSLRIWAICFDQFAIITLAFYEEKLPELKPALTNFYERVVILSGRYDWEKAVMPLVLCHHLKVFGMGNSLDHTAWHIQESTINQYCRPVTLQKRTMTTPALNEDHSHLPNPQPPYTTNRQYSDNRTYQSLNLSGSSEYMPADLGTHAFATGSAALKTWNQDLGRQTNFSTSSAGPFRNVQPARDQVTCIAFNESYNCIRENCIHLHVCLQCHSPRHGKSQCPRLLANQPEDAMR
ncbi:MAG: hypothetical protein MMC33_008600 [Icmadophila ericetorum]|nr:hypothetical protein [Icmadophila ericetorum]